MAKPLRWVQNGPSILESGDYKIVAVICGDPEPRWLLLLLGSVIGRFGSMDEAQRAAEMNRRRFA